MKRVLITGENSYIGRSFKRWVHKYYSEDVTVRSTKMKNEEWKSVSFKEYDTVLHVAGIAHVKEKHVSDDVYYKVNAELAFEVAKKAKEEKVKHFIFLSSMSVYGLESGEINLHTVPNPKTIYGISKYCAEKKLETLDDDEFQVAVLRPPMVYGRGCPGNYSKLSKLARLSPFFPEVSNFRSMIYVDHLSEFIVKIVVNSKKGVFFPQNKEYVNTSNLVRVIGQNNKNKNIIITQWLKPLMVVMPSKLKNKLFGNLTYDQEISDHILNYSIFSFEDSIKKTEGEKSGK